MTKQSKYIRLHAVSLSQPEPSLSLSGSEEATYSGPKIPTFIIPFPISETHFFSFLCLFGITNNWRFYPIFSIICFQENVSTVLIFLSRISSNGHQRFSPRRFHKDDHQWCSRGATWRLFMGNVRAELRAAGLLSSTTISHISAENLGLLVIHAT